MDWTRTRSVLGELGKLLTCAICESYLKDPCTLDNCDHNFCRKCIEESLGSDSKCPECGSFSWLKDLRSNHQLATTVNTTLKLQSLIGLNMEVEDVSSQDASELSENTFTFGSDEEMPDEDEKQQESCSEFVSTTKYDTTPSDTSVTEAVHRTNITKPSLVESSRTTETIRENTNKNVKQNMNATQPSVTVVPSTTESEAHHVSMEIPTMKSAILKQGVRKSATVRGRNSKTSKQRSTKSMDDSLNGTNAAINTTEDTNLHIKHVNQSNSKTKKSNIKNSGRKIKQTSCFTSESESRTVSETLVQATENSSSVKEPSNRNESTSMNKSNRTTKAAKTTTLIGNSKNHETPSIDSIRKPSKKHVDQNQGITRSKNSSCDKTVVKETSRKVSVQTIPHKKYSFRNRLNKKDSNLTRAAFDFTQQQDPFHFADDDDGESDDNDHDNDVHDNHHDDDHDNDDSDEDDHDANDHNDDDDDDDDNDGSKKIRLTCKSTHNKLPQGRKTRNKSNFGHDVEITNRILQSTSSAKTRLRNKGKTNVTREQTKKTQFTILKDKPRNLTQNDKSGIEEDDKNTSSKLIEDAKSKDHGVAVGGEDKENGTLNIKRRRIRPKRNDNIRQYLIGVDSADASDNSSDDGVPQKRTKSRNPSTSSSQNSRNAGALSQSSRNKRGETPLHLAAIKGDLALARELIKEGADPNAKDHAGWTSLHEACNHGHVGIVELFLDHGALLNIPGFDNDTPLHDAVANCRLKVVQLLVARGAVLTARNKQGLLPMDYAVTKKMKAALSPRRVSSSSKPAEDIENVKKQTDSCRHSPVVLGTALKTQDQVTLKKCIKLLAGTLVEELNESVTHVVTSVNENGHCPRTIKYLSGVLTGKWIVSFEWIKDCLRQRQWLHEAIYQVEGSCNAAKKSRHNTLQQMPRLLDGCSFFLRGVFKPPTPSKQDLVKLILLGGGKVLHREPRVKDDDLTSLPSSPIVMSLSRAPEVAYHAPANSTLSCCTEFIVYDSTSCDQPKIIHSPVLRTAPVTWLMDCISSFQLLDIPDV